MKTISYMLKGGFLLGVICVCLGLTSWDHVPDFHEVDRTDGAVSSDLDSLSYPEKYQEQLSSLATYFKEEGFDLTSLFEDSRFTIYERIENRFRRSAEVKSEGTDEYREVLRFDDKERRIAGFMNEHAEQLLTAEKEYGISRYIISAIIGIESNFGENMGSYSPFNVYVSMYATGYREEFSRAQLLELMLFAKRNNLDVFELKSSYAGAVSYAQFIPYSLNKWFVGGDIFDINNNILSVANYLAYFLERTGNIETAVLRYNPSNLYVRTVLDLAEAAERNHAATSGG